MAHIFVICFFFFFLKLDIFIIYCHILTTDTDSLPYAQEWWLLRVSENMRVLAFSIVCLVAWLNQSCDIHFSHSVWPLIATLIFFPLVLSFSLSMGGP